jgi:hypothetical protein
VPGTTGSSLADNAAITEMTSGGPIQNLNLESGMAHAKQSLASFKSKVASNNALKLTSSNIFTWICDNNIKEFKSNLVLSWCKEANTSAAIRKATSFYETILYQRQVKRCFLVAPPG